MNTFGGQGPGSIHVQIPSLSNRSQSTASAQYIFMMPGTMCPWVFIGLYERGDLSKTLSNLLILLEVQARYNRFYESK